jgi:hydrogenase maturation protease
MLVIGFGNTLRSDDGAGIRAAELVAEQYPEANCIITHELHPELAESLAVHDKVFFIDASVRVETMTVVPLHPDNTHPALHSHAHSPQTLLNLCRELYATIPDLCLLIELPAFTMECGEQLSPATQHAVQEAVTYVGTVLDKS